MSLKLVRPRIKIVAATVGVILLIFMIWLRITYINFIEFADKPRNNQNYTTLFDVNLATHTLTIPESMTCPTCLISRDGSLKRIIDAHIEISAPHDIVARDTASVKLQYRITENDINIDKLPQNIPQGTISFSSAGIEIKPENPFVVDKDTILPFTAIWTISAKDAGKHKSVLAISQSLIDPRVFKPIVTLNEGLAAETDVRNVEIPIVAYTVWGITSFQFELIKLILAIIVFVLTFPLITDFMKTFRKGGREPGRCIVFIILLYTTWRRFFEVF